MSAEGLHRVFSRWSLPRRRLSRVVAGAAAAAALVVGLPLPATAATATAPLQVVLTTANSGELTPGEPLRSFINIDNPTPTDTAPATATVSLDPTPITSRDALDDWFAGTTSITAASRAVAHSSVPSVTSQLSTLVSADAPSTSLALHQSGVYAVAVTVQAGSTVLGTARTAIAWDTASAPSVPVSIALPITVPAAETEFLSAADLTKYTGPNGILTRELSDVEDTPVAIGIDPRILASIRVLGKNAPASAVTWLDELAALPNESFPLQWADADLTAPLHAGSVKVVGTKSLAYAIDPSLFPTGGSTPTPSPTAGADDVSTVPTPAGLVAWNYTLPKLHWPADNSVEPADLAKLKASNIDKVILTSKNVDAGSSGLEGASAKSGSTAIAISDDALSDYLAEAVQATTRIGTTAAIAELTTGLALISKESGRSPRPVLLTLPRNWASADTSFSRAVSDLFAHPGLSTTTLSAILARTPVAVSIDKDAESDSRADTVAALLAAEHRVNRFSVIADNPLAITSSYRLQLLSLLSNEWLDTPAAWNKAVDTWLTRTSGVVASVQVAHSGSALALANQVSLPITVTNGLDQAVTVTLLVSSTTPRVLINPQYQTQTITIDADSQKRVQVPIEALSNGKGHVVVSLRAGNGLPIGRSQTLTVNVQAGWETLGTLIFVALVVALFAFGLIRRFRKSRREGAAAADE